MDRESPSWLQWQALRRSGQTRRASLIWKIAREPKALWVGRFTRPRFRFKVRRIIDAAVAEGAVPVLTVLRAESTECGPTYVGGGRREDRATRAWYDRLARAIGGDRVVIAFEPDSLGTIDCLAGSRRDDRLRLLRYGVKALSRLPRATVYLEAGASDWEPARRTAAQLRAIGIGRVRGFMLNATHSGLDRGQHQARPQDLAPCRRQALRDQHRRERARAGPLPRANGRRITVWCNPGLRGLGPPPTTDTSHPRVDAYLWINRPGYAQSCEGRRIGWFLPRALSYARLATGWERPPAGTRRGHKRRYPPRAFGIPR